MHIISKRYVIEPELKQQEEKKYINGLFESHVFQTFFFYHFPCKDTSQPSAHMPPYVWQVKHLLLLHMIHSVFCFIQFIFSNAGYDIKCMLRSFLWCAVWKIPFQDVAKQVMLERKKGDRQTDRHCVNININIKCEKHSTYSELLDSDRINTFSGRQKASSFFQNESDS